ncbi:ABC transporter ATP-binding protein [Acetobacter oeni]|nr:ABC transporter ATP-binding protein [Acetobacter oeni]MBB3883047.1 putative spermidine/putrescine transport system ATP-binding protein [Acetobacter oeni]
MTSHKPSEQAGSSLSVINATTPYSCAPLTFSMHRGECLALFDLSDPARAPGLLTDMLAGYLPLLSGQITVAGKDITARPPGKRSIGIVSHREVLFDHLTVRENVAFSLRVRRVAPSDLRRLTNEHLALLGLDSLADLFPPALSDGQYIRTSLARVLASDPAIIVLDNIFAGLNAETRRDIHLRLTRLRRARALSLLLITRDRSDALTAALRIGVVADGAMLQLGTASDLIERPVSSRIARSMGNANSLVGIVLSVEDDIARVRLACGGEMEAIADPALKGGNLTDLCVRPGQIAPLFQRGRDASPEESHGYLSASLLEAVHLGDFIFLRFRLEDGTEMIVHRPPGGLGPGISAGSPALLAWRAENALAFPSDGKPG